MSPLTFLLWLALITCAGWTAFPLAQRAVGADLPDGGLAVGRILFLGFWTMLAFWLGHLGLSVAACAWLYGPLALLGIVVGWRDRDRLKHTWRHRKKTIIATEVLFLLVFCVFFALRGFWSDTDGTNGEKSMDAALIGSLARAQHLPPPNPYSAGARINSYYYFGPLQTALLTRASQTEVRWSYNLMCATLPALCFPALFALGGALTGSRKGGAWVAGAVLCGGTLQPIYQWTHLDFYAANNSLLTSMAVSRIIPYTINEFPWFTFNQGDLHGHYFDFPFQIALMSLGWSLLRAKRASLALGAALLVGATILTNTWDFPAFAILIALSIVATDGEISRKTRKTDETSADENAPKSARLTDSTNDETVELLANAKTPKSARLTDSSASKKSKRAKKAKIKTSKAALLADADAPENAALADFKTGENAVKSARWTRPIARVALALGVIAGALIFASPFLRHLSSAAAPPQPLAQPASPLREWLLMWGPMLLGWGVFSAFQTLRTSVIWRATLALMGAGVIIAAAFGAWDTPSVLVLPIIGISAGLALAGMFGNRGAARYICVLALCGLLALAWSETTWAGFLGNAQQPLIKDSIRQDTVFKFGLQVWMLWGTAVAAGVWPVLARGGRKLKFFARLAMAPLALIMLVGNVGFMLYRVRFPDMVNAARAGEANWLRFDAWDGWAHLAPPEKAAANWLLRNTKPGENIVEAEQKSGGDFSQYARYTTATGIPTIIGPLAHSYYWAPANAPAGRGQKGRDHKAAAEWNEVFRRKADVQRIYAPMNNADREQMLRHYGVKYLMWGELERREYGDQTFADVASLPVAAQFGASDDPHRVTIFRVD